MDIEYRATGDYRRFEVGRCEDIGVNSANKTYKIYIEPTGPDGDNSKRARDYVNINFETGEVKVDTHKFGLHENVVKNPDLLFKADEILQGRSVGYGTYEMIVWFLLNHNQRIGR